MRLVPVIDLLGGQVVRARRGDRQAYRPIESALCRSSDPIVVARRLCDHVGGSCLYLADLDALQGRPAQTALVASLLDRLPGLQLWIDAGFVDRASADAWLAALSMQASGGPPGARVVPVFGSESLRSREALQLCLMPPATGILSLDRRHDRPLDPAGCWEQPSLWPRRVIVMTLDRVGADSGPDLQTLAEVRLLAPQSELIGAGGIRHSGDLQAARDAGAKGWLVASALHDLRLPRGVTNHGWL